MGIVCGLCVICCLHSESTSPVVENGDEHLMEHVLYNR